MEVFKRRRLALLHAWRNYLDIMFEEKNGKLYGTLFIDTFRSLYGTPFHRRLPALLNELRWILNAELYPVDNRCYRARIRLDKQIQLNVKKIDNMVYNVRVSVKEKQVETPARIRISKNIETPSGGFQRTTYMVFIEPCIDRECRELGVEIKSLKSVEKLVSIAVKIIENGELL